jgi:hypothetical protein
VVIEDGGSVIETTKDSRQKTIDSVKSRFGRVQDHETDSNFCS